MSHESFIINPTPEGLSALLKTDSVQVCKQLDIDFKVSMRKCKLRKLIAEYYDDNDEWDEDSLNMFLIDTSSDELELKKLELKIKIEETDRNKIGKRAGIETNRIRVKKSIAKTGRIKRSARIRVKKS